MTEIPVFSECVIGYRQWRVLDWVLAPASVGNPWRPGVNKARCQRDAPSGFWITSAAEPKPDPPDHHTAPHEHCECGLYAVHAPAEQRYGDEYVMGAVAAWGDLQVHYGGFRAQYAQIVALADQPVTGDPDLREIARLYGVPLVPLDMLTLEAERHGQSLPEAIRPPKPEPVDYGSTFWLPTHATWSFAVGTPANLSTSNWSIPLDDDLVDGKPKPGASKKRSNRQGPSRPKRAPKNLRPRKNR